MKLKIDFTNKVITVEEQCNAAELFQKLQELFPNDAWKEYKLETPVQYLDNWYYHHWYPYNPAPIYPLLPFSPTVTWTDTKGIQTLLDTPTTGTNVILNPTFTTSFPINPS